MNLSLSSIAVVLAVVFVVVGLIMGIFWFFKRADNLTDEDQASIKRSTYLWVGAAALGVLALALGKGEKKHGKWGSKASSSASRTASSLL